MNNSYKETYQKLNNSSQSGRIGFGIIKFTTGDETETVKNALTRK